MNQRIFNSIYRIIFDIVFLVVMFVLPWWISVGIALILLFVFESFWEIVAFAVFFDILYSSSGYFFASQFIFTIGALVSFVVVSRLKKSIIIYR